MCPDKWLIELPYRVLFDFTQFTWEADTEGENQGSRLDAHLFSMKPIWSPNPMFDHLLESSQRDDSNKWSNIEFSEEITQAEWTEVVFTHLIWSSAFSN